MLVVFVAAMALQVVPMSPRLRLGLSPALRTTDLQLRIDAPINPMEDAPRPLTVDSVSTMQSLALSVAVVAVFWCSRALFRRGGIRIGARAIAALGLGVAVVGIAQHLTAPHSLYWVRTFKFTEPFGPYMNRSDFAMWFVMALPLTCGYLLTRLQSRQRRGRVFGAGTFDNTSLFLTVAIGLMTAALMMALSRSGIIGTAAAGLTLWALSDQRLGRLGRARVLAGICGVVVVALFYANATAVATRINDTMNQGLGGRLLIWRSTLPMIRDFWLTGVGGGGFERAMIVYQPSPHETYFNHAHNEYLQLLAEGGVFLAIPALAVLVSGIAVARKRLLEDRTAIYWIRVGAVSGIVGVAVQSLWETGLRRPANTLLFAVVVGIALHSAAQPTRRASDDPAGVGER